MARPRKFRKVCSMPRFRDFEPCGEFADKECICLTVDEYEAIRLIDHEGMTQEQCGDYMKVARTTVQQIYNNARKKIAKVIVLGYSLKIDGGDFRLCDGNEEYCDCVGCSKHKRARNTINSQNAD